MNITNFMIDQNQSTVLLYEFSFLLLIVCMHLFPL